MNALHVVCPHCHTVNRLPEDRLSASPKCGKCGNALFTGAPVELSGAAFQTHIQRSDIPVAVDFWAPWCGPCRAMAPAFVQAAAQLEPRFRLVKLNTEDDPASAQAYRITGIPTLIMFRRGVEIARQSGAVPLPVLVNWIRSHG